MIPALLAGSVFNNQTPPIQPTTPVPQTPPPLEIPTPDNLQNRPLTIEEAVELAYELSPVLEAARQDAEAAKGRTEQAQAQLLPQINLNGGYSSVEQLNGTASNTNQSGWTAGLSVDQLLFDFNRTRDELRQRQALEQAAEQSFSAARNDLAFQVRSLYHSLAQAMENVAVSQANLTNREAQLGLAQARLDDGLVNAGDVVRARAAVADAMNSLVASQAQELSARTQLAIVIGVDPRTPFTITPLGVGETGAPDLTALVAQAVESRPEVLEARERVRAAELGISVAGKGNAPSVSLSAGLSSRGTGDPFESSNSRVGVNVSWPLFDSGFSKGRKREASALRMQALADLTQTQLVVTQEVTNAWVALSAATQQLLAAQVQLANAEEAVRIAQGRYQGQLGTFIEITDAQNTLVAAQRAVAQARADYLRARAALQRAIGSAAPPVESETP